MRLYQENGYVDIRAILSRGLPFNFVVGGRGTGKTYTALKTVLEDRTTFMLMRRTQGQTDLINKPEFSPFKSINADMRRDITSRPITKYNAGFYDEDGNVIGYTCALSTVANIRGFDASDIMVLIYDEFIPESHERPLKNEGQAFLNCYETLNRNRELKGAPPMQVLALANANDLSNAIFMELGLVTRVEKAMQKGQNFYIDEKRGIGVFVLTGSPISAQKQDTVLYRLSGNSDFSRMAIGNDFANRDYTNIETKPLREYTLLVTIGEISIYKHKSNGRFYVSSHKTGTAETFTTSEYDKKRFCTRFGWLWADYLRGSIDFENIYCGLLFTKMF